MFREVPVLPVVVPVAALAFVAVVGHVQRRGRFSLPRAAVALALCVYAAGVVANTVFPIFLDKPTYTQPWQVYLNVVPLVGYEFMDALTNVIVFVPLGILVPLLLARASWWRVVGVAACVSLMIEVTQYATAHLLGGGHVADVNDLIFNVIGSALGFAALVAARSRLPGADALIDRFAWHSSGLDE